MTNNYWIKLFNNPQADRQAPSLSLSTPVIPLTREVGYRLSFRSEAEKSLEPLNNPEGDRQATSLSFAPCHLWSSHQPMTNDNELTNFLTNYRTKELTNLIPFVLS
jgi:hypothetical protein